MKADSGGQKFQTTHWTSILQVAGPDSNAASDAFARLYLDYWYPLYAYVRRRGLSRSEAEDLTQDFLTRLLEKRALATLKPEGGRFRSFLLRSLDNFLANEWDRTHAQKRGSGARALSLNLEEGESRFALEHCEHETPESLFEKRWVFTLLEHVRERLRHEYAQAHKADLFDELRVYLQSDRAGPPYAEVASRRGMSEGAVKVAVHRLRHQYGELLRHEISRTVSSAAEVDEELRALIAVVGR
jgi:RNA polymerase sigma factor (sigma-70 family)